MKKCYHALVGCISFTVIISFLYDVPKNKEEDYSPPPRNTREPFIPQCAEGIRQILLETSHKRWQLELTCGRRADLSRMRQVASYSSPFTLIWSRNLICLKQFLKVSCYGSESQMVPNVIHYVWFGKLYLHVETLVSALSTVRYQRPCAVLFHTDKTPSGENWQLLLQLVPIVINVRWKQPLTIYGKKFGFIQHKADVARLKILHALGGIYLDSDQLVTASLTPFLQYEVVMSHENDDNLANSMIIAAPHATFVTLWLASYVTYKASDWGWHSTKVPWTLAQRFPQHIKILGNRFVNPDLTDANNLENVYHGYYNISSNLGLHLYTRLQRKSLELMSVTKWNSTLGHLWRDILFGSPTFPMCDRKRSDIA